MGLLSYLQGQDLLFRLNLPDNTSSRVFLLCCPWHRLRPSPVEWARPIPFSSSWCCLVLDSIVWPITSQYAHYFTFLLFCPKFYITLIFSIYIVAFFSLSPAFVCGWSLQLMENTFNKLEA